MIKHPWGHIDWLVPRIGERQWRLITCVSFEERCVALAQWIGTTSPEKHCVVRVDDPESIYTGEIGHRTRANEDRVRTSLGNRLDFHVGGLLDPPTVWNEIVQSRRLDGASIILDISTFPKRVFLFLVKRLLAATHVRDLVVCYVRPAGYREGPLNEDALPPSALPGFGRVAAGEGETVVIVSVGYVAFNLGDLLEQVQGRSLKFIFPFPPGSPAFRRNWGLMNKLLPSIPIATEIKRIHSMDMFEVLDVLKIYGIEAHGGVDLIPLGPKPHALAMGLAHRHLGDKAEIVYSQPRVYRPGYSVGVAKMPNGRDDISAYCLRRDYVDFV